MAKERERMEEEQLKTPETNTDMAADTETAAAEEIKPEAGSPENSVDAAAAGEESTAEEVVSDDPDAGEEEAGAGKEAAEAADEPEEADTSAGAEAPEDDDDDDEDAIDGEWKTLDGQESAEEPAAGQRKGFFKKKKDKRDQQIEELTDRVRRQMAEFDNFRKRTEKEKAAMYEVGARSVIEKILPVVDNFERGLAAVGDREDPIAEGMDKIYRQLIGTLESLDVKPIEAVGQTFNPDLHNAVMHVDDESVGENVVVEELQKGYTYRDTVVRYSMVKVAN